MPREAGYAPSGKKWDPENLPDSFATLAPRDQGKVITYIRPKTLRFRPRDKTVEDTSSVELREKRQREAEVEREREIRLDRSRQARESILAAVGKAEPLLTLDDLDKRLLQPKTDDLVREMRESIAEEERSALVEYSGNSAGYLSHLLDFHARLIEEWAERLYTVYCEVCDLQNRSASPDLIRAICDGPMAELIAARRSAVISQAGFRGMQINDPPNPYALSEYGRKIDRFAVRWNVKLESDAAAIEYRVMRSRFARSEAGYFSPKDTAIYGDAPAPDRRREVVIRKVQNPQANITLSLSEAMLYFEVGLRTIHRWIHDGKLRSGPRRGSVTIESVIEFQKKRSRKRRRD